MMNRIVLLFFPFIAAVSAADQTSLPLEKVIVLGSGMGSMTAALYLARSGIAPLIIEGPSPGGLITQSHSVQNWPGELEISGMDLADKVKAQVIANGAKVLSEEVVAVDFSKRPFLITTRAIGEEETVQRASQSIIIALGSKPKFLSIPGEQTYWGRGISNCAVCDGAVYRGKKVAVVGGGDAAVLEALYLSNIASRVTIFVRKGTFKGIEEKRIQTLKAKSNVDIVFHTQLLEVKGTKEQLTTLVLKTQDKPKTEIAIDGLFLAIGSQPNTSLFTKYLELDSMGYIVLKKGQQTSIPGVYAMGDIADPIDKQAITAAGDGAKAALQAERDLAKE